jgi:HEAT repeat protein
MFIRTTLLALLLAATAQAQAPANEQEELALAALEGLMAQSSDRALPILKKVLAGNQSTTVKRRALFVLGQIETPESREILLQTARSTNEALRGEAIRSIGIDGDPKSLNALQDIYNTGDADTRRDVLQAWMIADHKSAVYNVALNAKTEDEAAEAIRMLGAMGATDELRKLGDKPTPSRGLTEAYAVAGDLEGLLKIANGSGAHALRVDAVRRIGIIDGDAARKALRDIYTRSTDAEMKDAALQGLLIADDDKGVLALYRAAKTSEEKRTLLRTLSMMDSDAALEAIDATLDGKPQENRK